MSRDFVILYDDSCPMCRLYTKGFVRVGALPDGGRVAFADAPVCCPDVLARLNPERARVAIPLVDRQTGAVVYGLDTLFLLLRERFPALRPILRPALKAALLPLYKLISYNRRAIAGCAPRENLAPELDCVPPPHPLWQRVWRVVGVFAFAALLAPLFPVAPVAVAGCALVVLALLELRARATVSGDDAAGSLVAALVLSALVARLSGTLSPGVGLALGALTLGIELRRRRRQLLA